MEISVNIKKIILKSFVFSVALEWNGGGGHFVLRKETMSKAYICSISSRKLTNGPLKTYKMLHGMIQQNKNDQKRLIT